MRAAVRTEAQIHQAAGVRLAAVTVVLLHIMQLREVPVQLSQITHVSLSEGRMYMVVQA